MLLCSRPATVNVRSPIVSLADDASKRLERNVHCLGRSATGTSGPTGVDNRVSSRFAETRFAEIRVRV